MLMGGRGVSGGANLFPKSYEAASRRDVEQVASLQKMGMEFSGTLYQVGKHGSSFRKGLKCALALWGVSREAMAEPFQPFETAERN